MNGRLLGRYHALRETCVGGGNALYNLIITALDENLPPIPASKIVELSAVLDMDKWEGTTTHWAVKRVDLFGLLSEAGVVSDEQVAQIPENFTRPGTREANEMIVRPRVFSVPTQRRESDLVAVMMPFGAEFSPVYAAIRGACRSTGLHCQRADDVWQASVVIQDIFNLLVRCSIVVVDFSSRNANVMYETGIAHTLGRSVVPISQSKDDVPFDLRHHRFLLYHPNREGLVALETQLAERLKTVIGQGS